MPNFKHPCFVRVDDVEKRKEVTQQLEIFGYNCIYGGSYGDNVVCTSGNDYAVDYRHNAHPNPINCGTDTHLFLAIAAINNKNRLHQWYISNCFMQFNKLKDCVETESGKKNIMAGEWYKPLSSDIRFKFIGNFKWIEATPEEIIDHFKNK